MAVRPASAAARPGARSTRGGASGAAGGAAGARGGASHRVRIVGGQWKRTPLAVPDVPGLRPTPDRVRETLFNWLGQTLEGRACLDPFAGSGALGLEAASRGARRVVMIERDRTALAVIRAAIERLHAAQVELSAGDAFEALARLARGGERFDVVLLDPPFGQGLVERALPLLPALLAPAARVYVETDAAFEAPPGWRVERRDRAGNVHYHLIHRDEPRGPAS
ncbi:MAG: 16S rRNA (guanine(966)-N(2))-methyltransferase RsmD [Burkholderiaceae bacterium]|nr:16S rRNA (guanine(966)-N(2))-methyltransferase RsmD [Burkholderiaceae bacterium]